MAERSRERDFGEHGRRAGIAVIAERAVADGGQALGKRNRAERRAVRERRVADCRNSGKVNRFQRHAAVECLRGHFVGDVFEAEVIAVARCVQRAVVGKACDAQRHVGVLAFRKRREVDSRERLAVLERTHA